MNREPAGDTTSLVIDATAGDHAAADRLMALLYDEFRALARSFLQSESTAHTLQPTALVNEAYLRLVDQHRVTWKGRTHFFAIGAQVMRRVLLDHARSKGRAKRGGGRARIGLDEQLTVSRQRDVDLLEVHEAIEALRALDERQARIVELRFFGGLTVPEVAEVLGVSPRTVESEWTMIRAWLRRRLSDAEAE